VLPRQSPTPQTTIRLRSDILQYNFNWRIRAAEKIEGEKFKFKLAGVKHIKGEFIAGAHNSEDFFVPLPMMGLVETKRTKF